MFSCIKKVLKDLFYDPSSEKLSNIRVVSFIVAITPVAVWSWYVVTKEWVKFSDSISFLVLSAMGTKAVQKFAEKK